MAGRGWHLAGDDAHGGELEARVDGAEQPLEHRRIVTVPGLEVRMDLAGFENADLHGLALHRARYTRTRGAFNGHETRIRLACTRCAF